MQNGVRQNRSVHLYGLPSDRSNTQAMDYIKENGTHIANGHQVAFSSQENQGDYLKAHCESHSTEIRSRWNSEGMASVLHYEWTPDYLSSACEIWDIGLGLSR